MAAGEERGIAFVLWLDPAEPPDCTGRIEHVPTSRRCAFATADELIAFLLESRSVQPSESARRDRRPS